MTQKAVEMMMEPGAQALIEQMGKRMKTRARSKVIDRTLSQIREDFHVSDIAAWFKEDVFAPKRRTTVRLSPDNAEFLAALSQTIGKGRPAILMGLIYFTAANLSRDDLESLRV